MSDNRPKTPDRKFALIAPIAIGAAAVVVLLAVLLRPAAAPHPAPPAKAPPPVVAAPPAKPAALALGRADLITAAQQAASAYAAGEAQPEPAMVGRRFVLRLPFGCGGPALDPGPAQAYYQVDAGQGTIRLVARAAVWTDLPWLRAAPGPKDAESVEGFWIPRPWLARETCPERRQVAPPATPTPVEAPSLGLAVFHPADGSRAAQRSDRPYEQVLKRSPDPSAETQTYALVLEGRVTGFADGAAIQCWSESADHRPTCLYGVSLERVAFESADGAVLADWPG
jgi:hypothetical protein